MGFVNKQLLKDKPYKEWFTIDEGRGAVLKGIKTRQGLYSRGGLMFLSYIGGMKPSNSPSIRN